MKLNNLTMLLAATAITVAISCNDDSGVEKKIIASLEGEWTAISFEAAKCDTVIDEQVIDLICDDDDCLKLTFTDSSYNIFTEVDGRSTNEGGVYSADENVISLCFDDEAGKVCRDFIYSLSASKIDSIKTSTLQLKESDNETGCIEKTTYTKTEVVS